LTLKKNHWLWVGCAVAVLAAMYLAATAIIGNHIDAGVAELRSGALTAATNGGFDLRDIHVSSGFFTRSGTADLIIHPGSPQSLTFPVSFTIRQAPTLTSPAGVKFDVGVPTPSNPASPFAALHIKHLVSGDIAHGWGGGNTLRARMDSIDSTLDGAAIRWGGATLESRYSAADSSPRQINLKIAPLEIDNPSANTHAAIGEVSIVAQSSPSADHLVGAFSETAMIGASRVDNGKSAFDLRQASLACAGSWNFSQDGANGISIKNVDAQINLEQPPGTISAHLDALLPLSAQQASAIQSNPALWVDILGRSTAHANLSIPQSFLAGSPALAMLAKQYGRTDGRNIVAIVEVQGGHVFVNGHQVI